MRNIDWLVENKLELIADSIASDYSCEYCAWGRNCEGKGSCAEGVLEYLKSPHIPGKDKHRANMGL